MTTAQDGGKFVSLKHRPPLPPRKWKNRVKAGKFLPEWVHWQVSSERPVCYRNEVKIILANDIYRLEECTWNKPFAVLRRLKDRPPRWQNINISAVQDVRWFISKLFVLQNFKARKFLKCILRRNKYLWIFYSSYNYHCKGLCTYCYFYRKRNKTITFTQRNFSYYNVHFWLQVKKYNFLYVSKSK